MENLLLYVIQRIGSKWWEFYVLTKVFGQALFVLTGNFLQDKLAHFWLNFNQHYSFLLGHGIWQKAFFWQCYVTPTKIYWQNNLPTRLLLRCVARLLLPRKQQHQPLSWDLPRFYVVWRSSFQAKYHVCTSQQMGKIILLTNRILCHSSEIRGLHEMKNEKNYVSFLIHKIWQILKRFSRAWSSAQISYFWRVV